MGGGQVAILGGLSVQPGFHGQEPQQGHGPQDQQGLLPQSGGKKSVTSAEIVTDKWRPVDVKFDDLTRPPRSKYPKVICSPMSPRPPA